MSAPLTSTVDPPSGPPARTADMPSDSAQDVTPTLESASRDTPTAAEEPMIDPELADLPPPPHHRATPPNGSSAAAPAESGDHLDFPPQLAMSITESIAAAPPPRPTDFLPNLEDQEPGIDLDALEVDEDAPGSPTAKVMRAIAPPNASQPDPKWPPPPPNASVNLFIGRALLSNGNDNWPLKPNDIVNWIRKHYPSEWDGDEGRCSAHRVRTYLARKGADMYYEKLNQGCIAGWRIRQNHLWRFENGGFQGRGMKQEEAIAQAQKENEAIATAAHKAAAAEALAQGHPGVKTSMSQPGVSDGAPPVKRQRVKGVGQSRRKSTKKELDDVDGLQGSYYQHHGQDGSEQYATLDQHQAQSGEQQNDHAGPSDSTASGIPIDPSLIPGQSAGAVGQTSNGTGGVDAANQGANAGASNHGTGGGEGGMDISMVHQAMQAAAAAGAGQMDELEMGMQLPIEMQMHGGEHEEGERYGREGYYGQSGQYGQGNYGSGYYGYQHGQG